MNFDTLLLRGLERNSRIKAMLLSSWFFVTVATLWLLKPVRVASLLAHLGAAETPYVRLAGVVTVAGVVLVYSRAVDRLTRVQIVRWANVLFAAILVGFWLALRVGGRWLGAQRPFVWAVYIMVEIFSVVLVGIFWTYANDVVSSDEADRIYGVVGMGGIVGGAAGGAFVDLFSRALGPVNLLLICAGLVAVSGVLGSVCEAVLKPPPRHATSHTHRGMATAFEGAIEIKRSRYLMLLVAIVVAYEFTATLTDFGINVVFERAYTDEAQLTQMYGRLGWIVSGTAALSQLVLVPLLLPSKRIAVMLPPLAMLAGALGVVAFPIVTMAMLLAAADRGLNYSIQQATKESLYVPLTDAQKYKAKAFIDMFVDRAAKAMAAFVLIGVIKSSGLSVRVTLMISLISTGVWIGSARRLGDHWTRLMNDKLRATPPAPSNEPAASVDAPVEAQTPAAPPPETTTGAAAVPPRVSGRPAPARTAGIEQGSAGNAVAETGV